MEKNIPKLRFPEFEGEWEFKILSEVAEKRIQKNHKKIIKNVLTNSAVYGIVSQRDFFDKDIANPDNTDGYYIVEKNDFVYNPRISVSAPVGPISRCHKVIGIMSPLYSVFRFNTGDLNFIEIFFNTSKWHLHMENIANYGARADRMSFSIGDFYKMPIQFPSLPEQTKIANFLSAVDEKISQLKKKKDLLEKYKKGVMQKIFSQGLRFKDDNGQDFPEWEEKKLGDICKIYDGTHQTPNYVDMGIPFYSVEHVTANDFTNTKYITKEVFDKENQRVKLEKGDILMTRIGDIGTAKYINWDVEASFYVSLALIKKSTKHNNEFISHYIGTKHFQNELHKKTIHVAFPKKINLGEIGECLINIPNLPEQAKIANYLSAIVYKIYILTRKIESFGEWKKGLLQHMFV